MDSCDVLIVGGGPAGSSCAWKLRNSGLCVVLMDKQLFPRDKVCGGWITPEVLKELEISPSEYAAGRILQPITGFRTGNIGKACVETNYGRIVSYGIRRREFDDYLLKRSGAALDLGTSLNTLERSGSEWIVNGQFRAKLIVGAGGHFCPVARLTGAKRGEENPVVAQEAEFKMDSEEAASCQVRPEIPELYFCADMKGYGWCFRKENFLNVGLGRMDRHRLHDHVTNFLSFLKSAGRVPFELPANPLGHAYLLGGFKARAHVGDGYLLAGDAAGLAYPQSGEGIRPAIESGLEAAKTILAAKGCYTRQALESYRQAIAARCASTNGWAVAIGRRLPDRLIRALAQPLMSSHSFARRVILDRWFLHA